MRLTPIGTGSGGPQPRRSKSKRGLRRFVKVVIRGDETWKPAAACRVVEVTPEAFFDDAA